MRLKRHSSTRLRSAPPSALTIGNFDGFHRGHLALIERVMSVRGELDPALMCFEPLPATWFRPDRPVLRLLGLRDKLLHCRRLGMGQVYLPRFNDRFAALSPEDFVTSWVVATAGAKQVVVGEDFRFGQKAKGDVELLERLGRRHGFSVAVVEPVRYNGERISSSAIRGALQLGDLARANALLGRPYALSGRVLRGQQLGRKLGFPTANLRPPWPPAMQGIYAVVVDWPGGHRHPGVASVGVRPTVAGRQWLLEVHLFDYDGDLYGCHLRVEAVAYLRPEQRFESLDAMRDQMLDDAARARRCLAPDPP